jgi:hypothetical protein
MMTIGESMAFEIAYVDIRRKPEGAAVIGAPRLRPERVTKISEYAGNATPTAKMICWLDDVATEVAEVTVPFTIVCAKPRK